MGQESRPCSGAKVKIHHPSNNRRLGSMCVARLVSLTTVREAVCVLVVVALASMTITIHLGHHLNPLQPPPNDSNDRSRDGANHLNMHRSLQLSQRKRALGSSVMAGETLEGIVAADAAGGSVRNGAQYRNVLAVLQETERSTLAPDGGRLRVVVAGSSPQLQQDALLVEFALRKHSASVTYMPVKGDDHAVPQQLADSKQAGRWSVLLCLNTTASQDACVVSAMQLPLKPFQKVNVIPELQDLLHWPNILCHGNTGQGKGRWLNSHIQCSNVSEYSTDVSSDQSYDTGSLCKDHSLLLVPDPNSSNVQVVACTDTTQRSPSGVGLKLPGSLLTWAQAESTITARQVPPLGDHGDAGDPYGALALGEGDDDWRKAMTWRFPVLVTSLSPLRVYLHPEGVVWDGLEAYLQGKPHRSLSLLEIQQMAADHHGDSVASATVGYLEEGIMNVLVRWEVTSQHSRFRACRRCFQLLEATAVFNSTFFPCIIQVAASSLSSHLSSLSEYLMRQTSLNDLSSILGETRNVSSDLARGLIDMGLATVSKGEICNADKQFCLGSHELTYLLDSMREHSARTSWKRVYPSASAVHFTRLLQSRLVQATLSNTTSSANSQVQRSEIKQDSVSSIQLTSTSASTLTENSSVLRSKVNEDSSMDGSKVKQDSGHTPLTSDVMSGFKHDSSRQLTTAHLHSLLLGLESFYLRASDSGHESESFEDVNIPIDQTNQQFEQDDGVTIENEPSGKNFLTAPPCSDDPGTMPYLLTVVTQPALTLKPDFSPLRTEYVAEVNHTIQLVTVWTWSQNCQARARLEDKHNTDRSANFTLGLGSNTLRVFVVDTTHEEPWVLNTYTITVVRREADYGLGPLLPGLSHVVCSLKQDCSLPFAPREPCGLQPVMWADSWLHFLSRRDRLPVCTKGNVPGRWYVPCTSCRDDDGQCFWREAVWSSSVCKEPVLSHRDLQHCFADKKVLFIGDSTNRGILHYLSQRVNGSLQVWDKTHHLRVYPALNNNSTLFSFAYYPQFWLPAQHRPVFDKALYQLIRRTLPLDNSSKTVVVVGGVHWLAKHHLKVVQTALAREGLTGAQVIVKGLGSGFHQPVSGVHQLSQKEQEKLPWHNQHVLTYAQQQGMDVVDTFNMTMARYSHFLQGRCTCHFHRITPQKGSRKADGHTTYTVEGDINAAYAEMVINRICKPQ